MAEMKRREEMTTGVMTGKKFISSKWQFSLRMRFFCHELFGSVISRNINVPVLTSFP